MKLFDAGARGDRPQTVHDRVWTVANGITVVRLLGLPLFVWLMLVPAAYGQALLTLSLVAATDWVDGYVARRFDQVTRIGKVADPLIDRALLGTAVLTLWLGVGFVEWWVVVVIVARDLILVAGALLVFGAVPPIPVSRTGKFATACLLIGVPGFITASMDWPGREAFVVLAWLLTGVGTVAYYVAGARYVHAARIAIRLRGADGSRAHPKE